MQLDQILDKFIEQASELTRQAPGRSDIEKNLRALAQSTFSKLKVVTRDEFDAQTEVLARTRGKVEQLEQQIEQLSQQLNR